jgi:hypothetical protein
MRPRVPGDISITKMLDRDHVHDRTVRAFITNVDTTNGVTQLTMNGFSSSGKTATVPVLWASFPDVGQGTWGRFMPFENSTVKVSFDFDATPHIVGYDIQAPLPNVADGNAGWPQLTIAQSNGTQAYWTTLERGEFDFMSIGGAYIRGYASGRLLMQAGLTSAYLSKTENRNYEITATKSIQSQDSQFRFGEIRRPTTPGQPESQVPPLPAPSGKEFYVELYDPPSTPGTPGAAIGKFGFATKITMAGFGTSSISPLIGPFGSADRFIYEVDMPSAGTPMFQHEIDVLGNVSWHSSAGSQVQWIFDQATTVNMNSPMAAFSSTAESVSRSATTSITDNAVTFTIGSSSTTDWTLTADVANVMGTMVNLGTAPIGGVVDGTLLYAALQISNATLSTGMASIASLAVPATIAAWVAAFTSLLLAYTQEVAAAVKASTSLTVITSS